MKRLLKLGLMAIVSLSIWSCVQDDSTKDLAVSEVAAATEVNQFSDVDFLQRSALAALYESTGGANWLRNDNWNTSAPLSEWYGVKVEDGYVTSIDLSDNNLTGVLPAELVKLEKIQSIVLSGNKIGGQIPAAWGASASTRSDAGYDDEDSFEDGVEEDFGDSDADYDLDAVLAQLSAIADDGEVEIEGDATPFASSLAVLDLSDNLITGTLPEELGNLTKLRSLSISNNLMKGEISMALQQSAMWQGLSEAPALDQKGNNVLAIASPKAGNATKVTLPSKLSLLVGKKYTFKPTITPSSADVKAIKWKTGDKTIVAINSSGVIKGMKAGTANVGVYVYNNDGTIVTAKCKVTVTEDVPATGVKLNETEVSLEVDEIFQLTATITPDGATPKKVTWVSGDEDIVSVSSTGELTGLKAGTANVGVSVTNNDGTKVTAKCKVTVTEDVPATGVKLNVKSYSLKVGEKFTLKATITPDNATPKKVTWVSGDKSIVTVSSTGVVKGVKAGTANVGVYVYNNDGTKVTAKCKVTVKEDVPATEVKLNVKSHSLKVGEKYTLKATTTPADATPKSVVWVSGNESVVKVNNGVIEGVGAGTANVGVFVTNSDGTKVTAKCKVTVTEDVPATEVTLNKTSVSIYKGKKYTLTPTINPANATPKSVEWKSGNESVVKVNNGVIEGVGIGTANVGVYVTNNDGTKVSAKCKVTVKDPVVHVTDVTLNTSEMTLEAGTTEQLTATVNPSNATNKAVTWKSSNTSVATVNSTGKVTALKGGNAVITVTTEDGGKTATCEVTVLSTYNGNTEDFTGSGQFDEWDD